MNKTHIALGSSNWRDYEFLVPLTSILWRHVVGWEPIVILVEDEAFWKSVPRSSVVLTALREFGFNVQFIGHVNGPWEVSTLAQNSRQHSSALDIPDEDTIVLGDADLWPLQKDFYMEVDCENYVMTLLYSNAYAPQPFHCTCHMAAKAKVWREIMGLKKTGEIQSQLVATLRAALPADFDPKNSKHAWDAWNIDEHNTTRRIQAMPWYPHSCKMVPREGQPPRTRIDRSAWPDYPQCAGMVDAHMLRPAQYNRNWPKIRPILEQILPEYVTWADEYRLRYNASYVSDEK